MLVSAEEHVDRVIERVQSKRMIGPKSPPPEHLLALLEAAIRDAPRFGYEDSLTDEDLRWLGRADALLEVSGALSALVSFRSARNSLGTYTHSRDNLLIPLHDAYSRVELLVPTAMQGAFILGGDTWNGYAALVRLIQRECDDLLVVDPYLTSELFIDFAPHSEARKGLRCLTMRRGKYHPGLAAAAQKWDNDPLGQSKQVEVRYTPSGTLHDRLIILDGAEAWLVSQSFKDIAKRSPASVSRADEELARLKAEPEHYSELWRQSTPIV
jgi:hypothetical protein